MQTNYDTRHYGGLDLERPLENIRCLLTPDSFQFIERVL